MKRLQAVNNILILKKDRSYLKDDPNLISETNYKSDNMAEIPEPYTGTIDSIGVRIGSNCGSPRTKCRHKDQSFTRYSCIAKLRGGNKARTEMDN